jgi:ribosomal protein L11 methyltransferase (prmA)
MSNQFDFKQFSIRQDLCGMKVGTDGVLLGAWASGGQNILDIGTGTGLIALMMAQRYPTAYITALDIESKACLQAQINADLSSFGGRIEVIQDSIQHFSTTHQGLKSYDCIVSNPPFFVNSLKSKGNERTLARHTDSLSYSELFRSVSLLLSENGMFSTIIPADYVEQFISEGYIFGLFLTRRCFIRTVESKPFKRCLLAFEKQKPSQIETLEVCMQTSKGAKTQWYTTLTGGFYIK